MSNSRYHLTRYKYAAGQAHQYYYVTQAALTRGELSNAAFYQDEAAFWYGEAVKHRDRFTAEREWEAGVEQTPKRLKSFSRFFVPGAAEAVSKTAQDLVRKLGS